MDRAVWAGPVWWQERLADPTLPLAGAVGGGAGALTRSQCHCVGRGEFWVPRNAGGGDGAREQVYPSLWVVTVDDVGEEVVGVEAAFPLCKLGVVGAVGAPMVFLASSWRRCCTVRPPGMAEVQ